MENALSAVHILHMRGRVIGGLAGNSRSLIKQLLLHSLLFKMSVTSGITVTVLNPPVTSKASGGTGGSLSSSALTAAFEQLCPHCCYIGD